MRGHSNCLHSLMWLLLILISNLSHSYWPCPVSLSVPPPSPSWGVFLHNFKLLAIRNHLAVGVFLRANPVRQEVWMGAGRQTEWVVRPLGPLICVTLKSVSGFTVSGSLQRHSKLHKSAFLQAICEQTGYVHIYSHICYRGGKLLSFFWRRCTKFRLYLQ